MVKLYLNNDGSRIRVLDDQGKPPRVAIRVNDVIVTDRAIDAEYAFGNWAGLEFRYAGKRFKRLPNDWDYSPEGYAIVDLTSEDLK